MKKCAFLVLLLASSTVRTIDFHNFFAKLFGLRARNPFQPRTLIWDDGHMRPTTEGGRTQRDQFST